VEDWMPGAANPKTPWPDTPANRHRLSQCRASGFSINGRAARQLYSSSVFERHPKTVASGDPRVFHASSAPSDGPGETGPGRKTMLIEKWYLDCVTADGAGLIGYAARMGWGPVSLRCAETLQWRPGDPAARERTRWSGALPATGPDGVAWRCRGLDTDGRWQPRESGIATVTLLEEPAGRVEWTCLCPAARVSVNAGGRPYDGWGYAERLVMTLPPAKLPIRELRWGRFLADAQSCVWVRWRGPVERNWCFHQGKPVDAAMPDSHHLAWGRHRLQLEPGTTIRTGRVADTAWHGAGVRRWLLPKRVRGIQETKWCSRGTLIDPQGRAHPGWAIHEVATFP
jgi:hypothetical protein